MATQRRRVLGNDAGGTYCFRTGGETPPELAWPDADATLVRAADVRGDFAFVDFLEFAVQFPIERRQF